MLVLTHLVPFPAIAQPGRPNGVYRSAHPETQCPVDESTYKYRYPQGWEPDVKSRADRRIDIQPETRVSMDMVLDDPGTSVYEYCRKREIWLQEAT